MESGEKLLINVCFPFLIIWGAVDDIHAIILHHSKYPISWGGLLSLMRLHIAGGWGVDYH